MSQFHPISPSALSRERRRLLGLIHAAAGEEPADLVLKNARYVNIFSQEVCRQDIAVKDGVIVGLGDYRGREEIDLSGRVVCPGRLTTPKESCPPSEMVRAHSPG